ncbi:MAG: hypothetical protein DPW18_12830 [Chloroflexi bacterium]|nr:hypothetical protein [Chloroflexota bacterium]MDL1943857.1 hypothetical protein [Chloroflexi bacterium CFX2]
MYDKQPSLLKIIWIDYWAFLSAIFCVIAPGFYLYDLLFSQNRIQNLSWYLLGVLALALFGLVSRYVFIVSLYNSGLEARATVSEAGFFRDRGYIKYIYSFENRKYAGRMTVMKNKFTTRYRIGDEVEVVVDRENPKNPLSKTCSYRCRYGNRVQRPVR